MKNFKKKQLNSSNGITLIALVITIIVLLILAGISISMLSGDNSILQKATDAKTETEKGQEKEIVALAYNSALAKKVSNGDSTPVTVGDLNLELTNHGASASESNPIIVTFTNSKRKYTINSNGKIEFAGTKSDDEPQEKTLLQALKDNDISIGDFVNYNAPNVSVTISEEDSGTSNQTINVTTEQSTSQMGWRILGYGNSNGELTLDKSKATNVLLISANGTEQYLELGKSQGYLNGSTILNEICTQFSSDKTNASNNFSVNKTTGRSVTIQDLYTEMNWKLETDKINDTYVYQNGDWVIGIPLTQINTNTNDSNRSERTIHTENVYSRQISDEEMFSSIIMYSNEFWFASKNSYVYNNAAYFALISFADSIQSALDMFCVNGNVSTNANTIRPIISLSSNTMYGLSDGEINKIDNPFE